MVTRVPAQIRVCWVPPEQSRQARDLAAAAGLGYVDDVYIADTARGRAAPG